MFDVMAPKVAAMERALTLFVKSVPNFGIDPVKGLRMLEGAILAA